MTIFLCGVSCVGKTTVGHELAKLLQVSFVDLDHEVERHFGESIERLQQRFGTMDRYRDESAKVLDALLLSLGGRTCIIALPPSGLMGAFAPPFAI